MNEVELLKKEILDANDKNKKLEDLSEIQGDLFRMTIHDLKGPVGEIMANLDMLNSDESLSDLNKEYLETSILGCDDLFRMIMNILDISKIEEGAMNLNRNTFPIEDLIKNKLNKLKVMMKQNDISLIADVKEGVKPVCADKEIIERVLTNLLLNALEHSSPDSEIIMAAEALKEKDEDYVKISVIDYGKGISKDYIDKVFDKFCQETTDGERRQGSTGLGLTFCKMAVEAHKGKIWVESEEGKGSTFSFIIPAIV